MRRILPYLTIVLFLAPSAAAQEPLAQPGVSVQDRGPVHEAFAQPADPSAPQLVVSTPPPAPINELPPEQKPEGENVQWVPGYWSWDDGAGRYLWVSGCWRVPPPGREWVAGSWVQANGNWQWQPGFWSAPGGVQTYPSAPPESLEAGPSSPAPDADSYYVPGQWVFRDGNWLWQPGSWVQNPNGMVYVPTCYLPTPSGSLCNSGYWDYPLEDRGLLFAPVCFNGSPWVGNPGWSYRPSYGVTFAGLLGSLFARPGYGGYYFGNYFGAPYRSHGYVPWAGGSRRGYDPLLNYYTWANRGNPGWSRGLSGLYGGRMNGSFPAQAAGYDPAVISRNTVRFGRNVSVNPVTSVNTVAPMSRLNGGHVRLTNVTRPEAFVRPSYPSRQSFAGEVAGRHAPGGQPHAPAVRPAAHLTAPAQPGAGVITAAPRHGGMPHAHPTAPAATTVTPTHHSPPVTLRQPSAPPVGAGRPTAPPAAPVVHPSPSAPHHGVALRPPQAHPAVVPPAPAAHAHAAPTVHAPAGVRPSPAPVVRPSVPAAPPASVHHLAPPAPPHAAVASSHPAASRPTAVRPAPAARPPAPAPVHHPAPQRAAAPPRPAPARPAPAAHPAPAHHPTPHAAPQGAGHSAGNHR